jgi:hypothetical protein
MLVLSDDETVVVGRAFDRAWEGFLKKGLLTPHNFHESRSRLADRILRSAGRGERDAWRLAREALIHVQDVYAQEVGRALMVPTRPHARRRRLRTRLQQPRGSVGRTDPGTATVPSSDRGNPAARAPA